MSLIEPESYRRALEHPRLRARCYVVLKSHVQLVDQAERDYERDPDPALRDQVDGGRPPDVESEPAGDFAGWVREINDAVAEAERAAPRRQR